MSWGTIKKGKAKYWEQLWQEPAEPTLRFALREREPWPGWLCLQPSVPSLSKQTCSSPLKHSADETFSRRLKSYKFYHFCWKAKMGKIDIKNEKAQPKVLLSWALGGRSKPKHLVAINMPCPFAVLIPVQMQSVVILITSCGAPFFWKAQRQLKCDPSPSAAETKGNVQLPEKPSQSKEEPGEKRKTKQQQQKKHSSLPISGRKSSRKCSFVGLL